MNQKKVLFALFFALIISQIVFAAAATPAATPGVFVGENSVLSPIMKYVFGIDATNAANANEAVILFAIWLIFFIAASDVLKLFSMFTGFASWLIGFALAIILANTGATYGVGKQMFELTANLAGIVIAVILIMTFIVAMLFHFGVTWSLSWFKRVQIAKAAAEGTEFAISGAKAFKGVGKIMAGKKNYA